MLAIGNRGIEGCGFSYRFSAGFPRIFRLMSVSLSVEHINYFPALSRPFSFLNAKYIDDLCAWSWL